MIIPRSKNKGKYSNAKVGRYFPLHPEKYIAENKVIIFKSQLEQRFMLYLDKSPNVVAWTYEPHPIKYYDVTTQKTRKYYIDFVVVLKGNPNKTCFCEVKCKKETVKPKNNKNIQANMLWLKNQSKWKAAEQYCSARGFEFKLITEDQLC